ncbi:uncharacterized protein LOC111703293 [Eurytemora carolleeae]|uniref:uncharacterized protein LOC111703293 n=1 Tax=Eurytemora carolleeae TaxID=1294199 RepID=UPI000C782641|nr:uncharacterized protein LOC111703293 [Eurytemora carolleeae]|eukprot:XP_023330957.1 uncharacterized protein LOC111703293 [Eurytemora affinis]
MDEGVDKLVNQLDGMNEKKRKMERNIQNLKQEKMDLQRIVQERSRIRTEVQEDLDQQIRALSARNGRVESLQAIFNSAKEKGEEVQELAREHVKCIQLLENRRVDILQEYEERTDKFLKHVEFSPLNHPRPDIKGDLDKIEIKISNLRAEKQKNQETAFSVNAPESETGIDDRCQEERRSQKNLEEHISTPAGPDIQEKQAMLQN